MSNFSFLSSSAPSSHTDLHDSAVRTEQLALADPRGASFYARRTLELAVRWLYEHDALLCLPYDNSLSALIHEPIFRAVVPRAVWLKMRLLKELGNEAIHPSRRIEEHDGLVAARELFHILYWLARTYTPYAAERFAMPQTFDPATLSVGGAALPHTVARLKALQLELSEKDHALRETEATQLLTAGYDAQIATLKADVAAAKRANAETPDAHNYSEAQTHDYFIDLLLREAGWGLLDKRDREFEVEGMPNAEGKGFVDYVLWGDDGLPLAVVEAKRTKTDAHVGRTQAELYANCLESRYGRRPLIFYTNGYEHHFYDDRHYPPRPVRGFFTKDELERFIRRRGTRKGIETELIDTRIVGRYYQTEAIRAITSHFEADKQRKALAVMATSSGKTRTVNRAGRCSGAGEPGQAGTF